MPHAHARAHHNHNGRVAPAHNGRAAATPRRKTVLVVEDHASVGGLIAALVRQEGYRAVRAWDPQEALRLARGRTPDLVLFDLNLTYPDGLDILHQVSGNDVTRRTPVVIVAAADLALLEDDLALIADIVHKPFDIDVMLNAVRKALGDPVVAVQPRQFEAQDYFLNGY